MQQKTDSHGYWSLSKFLKYKATKRIAPLPEWHNSQSQATRMSIPAFSQVCLTLLGNHFYSWVGKGTKRVRFMYLANDTSSCSTRKFATVDPEPTALHLSLPRPPKKEWELSNLLGLRCLMKVARGSLGFNLLMQLLFTVIVLFVYLTFLQRLPEVKLALADCISLLGSDHVLIHLGME